MKAEELAKEIRDRVWNYGDDPVGIIADIIRPHILEGRCVDCKYYESERCEKLNFDFLDFAFGVEEDLGCNLWAEIPEGQE